MPGYAPEIIRFASAVSRGGKISPGRGAAIFACKSSFERLPVCAGDEKLGTFLWMLALRASPNRHQHGRLEALANRRVCGAADRLAGAGGVTRSRPGSAGFLARRAARWRIPCATVGHHL